MEGADHGGLGRASGKTMIDHVDEHRDAQNIREQHVLLALPVALVSGARQKVDRIHPLGFGGFNFTDEVVHVSNERG